MEKPGILLEPVVKPIVFRIEADQDTRGFSVPCNDDGFLFRKAKVLRQIVF